MDFEKQGVCEKADFNRPFSRWGHWTTTTKIQFVIAFLKIKICQSHQGLMKQ